MFQRWRLTRHHCFLPAHFRARCTRLSIPTKAESRDVPQQTRGERSESFALRAYSIFDRGTQLKLNLSKDLVQQLLELPGTTYTNVNSRAKVLAAWKDKLRKGALPKPTEDVWPAPVLQQQLSRTLSKLEMPRFCRRYPQLLDSLLKQLVQVMHDYEAEMAANQDQQPQSSPPQNMEGSGSAPQSGEDGQQQQQEGSEAPSGDPQPTSPQDLDNGSAGSGGNPDGQSVEIQLDDTDLSAQQNKEAERERKMKAKAEELAAEVVDQFEKEWAPIMEGVKEASETFDNLEGLMEGPHGFDNSKSVWKDAGWREVRELRRMLEDLKELTTLVRSLGRSSGKGKLRRAPQEIYASRGSTGVHRSPLQPEETHSLGRSGDISRMLPFEMHLLAAKRASRQDAQGDSEEGKRDWGPLRRLHMARRAERALLSYERTGWLENEPTRITAHNEVRPSSEMGPIICCLDTSGSMHGARETVAKAVTLECMRGAYRQKRQCYLYAFGGPGEVKELFLDLQPNAMHQLLSFLRFSFGGGTDVDRPLEMSLERLKDNEWKQADILMVTDGELPPPNDQLLDQLRLAKEEMGLEVHGLLVGRHQSEAMQQLATHLHVFKSWSTVKASKYERV